MKRGIYEPRIQEKGVNEACIDGIKEGQVYWTIQLDKGIQMDVKTQFEAEVMVKLINLEMYLTK